MDEKDSKRIIIAVIVIILFVLAFLVLRPILISVLAGFLLAYILFPVFKKLDTKIKHENLTAFIIVIIVLLLILAPLMILLPIMTRQMINAYLYFQQIDISSILNNIFPSLFESASVAADINSIASTFSSKISAILFSTVQNIAANLPSILLQMSIVLFTFFFALRDFERLKEYFISISPFEKEYHAKFNDKFQQITNSVIYSQILAGVIQGIACGLGYFMFGVEGTLLLTILSIFFAIIPIIGPWIVWVPVDIHLFLTGNNIEGIGLFIYGMFVVSWIDNIVKPMMVSKMAKMNSGIVIIGMVGGLYTFGIMGLILGPLILAYLLLIVESYRERKVKSLILHEPELAK